MNKIHLVLIGNNSGQLEWPIGQIYPVQDSIAAITRAVNEAREKPFAWLFWDSRLGQPDLEAILKIVESKGDSWHSGLRFETSGLPELNDFVSTTWMFNCNADPEIESTSWRLNLRAALIKQEVIEKIGFLLPDFESLDAASLELGHRYITRGVLLRHHPALCRSVPSGFDSKVSYADEARFLYYRFGNFWARWGLFRGWTTGHLKTFTFLKLFSLIKKLPARERYPSFHERTGLLDSEMESGRVSVLIPTLNRYPYLRKLLSGIREQTIRPHEVIVVDQSVVENREYSIADQFPDIPLKVIYRNQPGQCSSRNEGIQSASGDFLLLLDDDLEIKPDLIALHLSNLKKFKADASCGVLEEIGAGPLAENFKLIRASDVFPGSNTMVRFSALQTPGLFDLAYERGARADGDLGTRVYLSGALMVLNPDISVIHHHAPSGGLRYHKARVITYASSRSQVLHRHLPSVTEIYFARRYHSKRVVTEMLWARALGTMAMKGSIFKKFLKLIVSTVMLPGTILEIRKRNEKAKEMLREFPKIPVLERHPTPQAQY